MTTDFEATRKTSWEHLFRDDFFFSIAWPFTSEFDQLPVPLRKKTRSWLQTHGIPSSGCLGDSVIHIAQHHRLAVVGP